MRMRRQPKDMIEGMTHRTVSCGDVEIIKYENSNSVLVRFLSTGTEIRTYAQSIRSGSIKDPYQPSLYGVGCIGIGEHLAFDGGEETKEYKTWRRMIERCYSDWFHERNPSYADCEVCDEWLVFQSFASWMKEQDSDCKELDKDIRIEGNKVYSPDACCFVPRSENLVKAQAKSYRFLSPNGEIVDVYNLREFSKDNGLDSGNMNKVFQGKVKSCKGWRAVK